MKTIKLFFSTLLVVIISAIGMVSCMHTLSLLFLTRYVLWWHLAAVPMLKYIVTEDDFRYVTTTMNKGEQLTYVLILANANKKGIQRLELTLERK